MSIIITTDLHFTDSEKDSYMLDVLPWLLKQVKYYGVTHVFILGDITDKKDKHPSRLVNKIADGLAALAKHCTVYVLKGNHDYYEEDTAFFSFLNHIDNIFFVSDIHEFSIRGSDVFSADDKQIFLPHTRTPEEDWKKIDFSEYDYVYMHETINGSRASNGQLMDGLDGSTLKDVKKKIYSGDIHVPQKLIKGKFVYIGCPYRVRFNDEFEPRVLLLTKGAKEKDLYFDCLKRHTLVIRESSNILELAESEGITSGDQVKIRVRLSRSELVEWQSIKSDIKDVCEDLGIDISGIELQQKKRVKRNTKSEDFSVVDPKKNTNSIIDDYAKKENLDKNIVKVGKVLVRK